MLPGQLSFVFVGKDGRKYSLQCEKLAKALGLDDAAELNIALSNVKEK